MATNLAINQDLLIEAQKVGHHKTKRGTVDAALKEYIQRRHQREIIKLFGKIKIDDDYDYKSARDRHEDNS